MFEGLVLDGRDTLHQKHFTAMQAVIVQRGDASGERSRRDALGGLQRGIHDGDARREHSHEQEVAERHGRDDRRDGWREGREQCEIAEQGDPVRHEPQQRSGNDLTDIRAAAQAGDDLAGAALGEEGDRQVHRAPHAAGRDMRGDLRPQGRRDEPVEDRDHELRETRDQQDSQNRDAPIKPFLPDDMIGKNGNCTRYRDARHNSDKAEHCRAEHGVGRARSLREEQSRCR